MRTNRDLGKNLARKLALAMDLILEVGMTLEKELINQEEEQEQGVGPREGCAGVYDKRKKVLTLKAPEKDFDKGFLKYMLEYMELPADTKIVFAPATEEKKENTHEN